MRSPIFHELGAFRASGVGRAATCGSRAWVAGVAALLPVMAAGFSLNRNAAHIEWRTAETEHFRFHYAKELEDVAATVAGIAERVYPEKIQRYHIQLPNKVEF